MLGLSLPSRLYSSSTLMDGEDLVGSQQFDNWGEDELYKELAKLKADFEQKFMSFDSFVNNFDFCF